MNLKVFTLPWSDAAGGFDDAVMERFLERKTVLAVSEHLLQRDGEPAWALLVTYREPPDAYAPRLEPRADEVRAALSPPEQALYEALRLWRNERAKRDGRPPFALLTNRQLGDPARGGRRTGRGRDGRLVGADVGVGGDRTFVRARTPAYRRARTLAVRSLRQTCANSPTYRTASLPARRYAGVLAGKPSAHLRRPGRPRPFTPRVRRAPRPPATQVASGAAATARDLPPELATVVERSRKEAGGRSPRNRTEPARRSDNADRRPATRQQRTRRPAAPERRPSLLAPTIALEPAFAPGGGGPKRTGAARPGRGDPTGRAASARGISVNRTHPGR